MNVFILGAAKAGTTYLFNNLSHHPRIRVAVVKEPNYFNTDFARDIKYDVEKHEDLFDVSDDNLLKLEASVLYLYSKVAVAKIEKYYHKESKYIVCLRNPVDLAFSSYKHLYYGGGETVESFEAAWNLIPERKKLNKIPRLCRDPKVLFYDQFAKLGDQVERLLSVIDRDRVHFVVFNDLQANPQSVINGVTDFLNIESIKSIPKTINPSRQIKFKRLHYILTYIDKKIVTLAESGALAKVKPLLSWLYFLKYIRAFNAKTGAPWEIERKFELELRDYFFNDVKKLEILSGINLEKWHSDE